MQWKAVYRWTTEKSSRRWSKRRLLPMSKRTTDRETHTERERQRKKMQRKRQPAHVTHLDLWFFNDTWNAYEQKKTIDFFLSISFDFRPKRPKQCTEENKLNATYHMLWIWWFIYNLWSPSISFDSNHITVVLWWRNWA